MEDKKVYNKIMFISFCLIIVLLCAGSYSYFNGRKNAPEIKSPVKNARVLIWEEPVK
ncbi:hypothetical protein [Lacrimispora sp.]|uniref:hypothetical protein n=1 Tax=Lacrimispora sp. TaxID=2719234 RepID=UPI003994DC1B